MSITLQKPWSKSLDGGTQPPGTGGRKRQLRAAVADDFQSLIFAGTKALNKNLPPRLLRTERAKDLVPIASDTQLAEKLDSGHDWVRLQLTAAELLSHVSVSSDKASSPVKITIQLGERAPLILIRPSQEEIFKAVADVAQDQKSGRGNQEEILAQANDAGLYFALAMRLGELGFDHILQIFDVVELVLAWPLYEAKLVLDVDRPTEQAIPEGAESVENTIPIPRHQSFPSGHASYSYLLASLFSGCLSLGADEQQYLEALAERTAQNRQFAGLHTALDSAAGKRLGNEIAGWLIDCTREQVRFPKWCALVAQAQREWRLRDNEI